METFLSGQVFVSVFCCAFSLAEYNIFAFPLHGLKRELIRDRGTIFDYPKWGRSEELEKWPAPTL